MLARWREGFGRMRQTVATKLTEARGKLTAASGDAGRTGRARSLLDDAEFNLRYVTLGGGAHNVFYASNLLRRANGWADEAVTALGHSPARTDDALVRGGYCAVLCHEPLGRGLRDTVAFRGQRLPHARHVAELGATCTTCHSADVHRVLSATPATCGGCHHSPGNERCETCHRPQAAFYRGQTTTVDAPLAPNRMADAVACTGCHDWSHKHSRGAVREKCQSCHDASYLPLMTEWTTGFDQDLKATTEALRDAERALAAARRGGRASPAAETLLKQAREAHALVRAGGAVHNPLAADAILSAARENARRARQQAAR
jgi:hypothetical protein